MVEMEDFGEQRCTLCFSLANDQDFEEVKYATRYFWGAFTGTSKLSLINLCDKYVGVAVTKQKSYWKLALIQGSLTYKTMYFTTVCILLNVVLYVT